MIKRSVKRTFAYILSLGLIFSSVPVNAAVNDTPVSPEASTENISDNDVLEEETTANVSYIDENGQRQTLENAEKIENDTTDHTFDGNAYYVEGNITTYNLTFSNSGDVTIVLKKGAIFNICNMNGNVVQFNGNLKICAEEGSDPQTAGRVNVILNNYQNATDHYCIYAHGGNNDLCFNGVKVSFSSQATYKLGGIKLSGNDSSVRIINSPGFNILQRIPYEIVYCNGNITIKNSSVNIGLGSSNAHLRSVIRGKNIYVEGNDTSVTINSGYSGIHAENICEFNGGTVNVSASKVAVAGNVVTVKDCKLTAMSTGQPENGCFGITVSTGTNGNLIFDLSTDAFVKASSYYNRGLTYVANAGSFEATSNFINSNKIYLSVDDDGTVNPVLIDGRNLKDAAFAGKKIKAGYSVAVDGGIANGSLVSDKGSGISVDTVTLTPTPVDDYAVETVTYRDSAGTHTVNRNAAGLYQFTTSLGVNTVSATFRPITYSITYAGTDGATFVNQNPTTYNVTSAAIRLSNPDRDDAIFKGWEGTDIDGASKNVNIPAGSHGDRTYTATWIVIKEAEIDNGEGKGQYSTEKAESFIHNLYRGILDREADEEGLRYWTDQLKNKNISLYQLVKGFTDSTEFTGRGLNDADFIRALYRGVLSRTPEQSEVDSWLDQMNNHGYSRDDVIVGFLCSKELMNLQSDISESLGNGKTLPIVYYNQGIYDFVIRNYVCILDREGEPEGVEYWGKILLAGKKTPEEVVMGFINSKEFRSRRISSEEYVRILYRTFLGREPDEEGLKYWTGKLRNGSSREDIVPGFSNSEEFKALLKKYGL